MIFTLIQAASKKCLQLKGRNHLPKVIEGIVVSDVVEVTDDNENRALDYPRNPNSNIVPTTPP
jgi:hypothetical protein